MSTDANKDAEDQVDRAVLVALRQHADAGVFSEEDDAALISAAVAGHLEVVQQKRTRKSVAFTVTGLLAAAAAAAWLLLPADMNRDTTRADAGARSQSAWVLEPRATPLEGVVAPTDGEACGARRDARACLTPGSRAVFEPEGNIQLHEGTARIEARGPISLFLAGVRVQATTDAANFIATLRARMWVVSVESGTVTVTRPDGAAEVVEAGESAGSQPPELAVHIPAKKAGEPSAEASEPANQNSGKNPKPTPSADTLLELARSQRAARDFAAAAQTYEQLIRTYPNSAKVRANHVSLAQLYQGPLDDPANALRHFDQYLERGGPLAEDAHYGKIRALRSLGRAEAARTELEAFLRTYPDSAHADALGD